MCPNPEHEEILRLRRLLKYLVWWLEWNYWVVPRKVRLAVKEFEDA